MKPYVKHGLSRSFNALDINFFADAQDYSICVMHALACYLIVGAGAKFLTPHNVDKGWVFPNLAAGTATTMLSNFLKECSTSIPELHSDITATDLRVGICNFPLLMTSKVNATNGVLVCVI